MRACLFAACAALLLATTGCHGINLAKGHCDQCGHGHGGGHGYCDQCNPSAHGPYASSEQEFGGQGYGGDGHGGGGYGGGGYGGGGYGGGGYGGGGHVATHGTPGFPPTHHHHHREYVGPQGPATAQVGYPYYTIRGPRDFLIDNPPSIGR